MAGILNKLIEYNKKKYISMHMPGHKSGTMLPEKIRKTFGEEVFKYDLTEVEGLDNLQDPEGAISETEKRICQVSGAAKGYILVNGSTCGLLSVIYAIARDKEIFVARNCHKSVYNALIIARAKPIYLDVDYDEETGLQLGLNVDVLEDAIKRHPECKNIVLTYPNYYGILDGREAILDTAKRKGINTIVDEAHGAYFNFFESIDNAISLGADFVIQSWHKTLPVINQGSVILVNEENKDLNLREYINMFQTTSPSYLILGTIDASLDYLEPSLIEEKIEAIGKKMGRHRKLNNMELNFSGKYEQDPFKLLITSKWRIKDKVKRVIIEKYRFQPEILEESEVLFMLPMDISEEVLETLFEAIYELDLAIDEDDKINRCENETIKSRSKIVEPKLLPFEVFEMKKEVTPLEESEGKILGQLIYRYPPGVPEYFMGEIITKEIIETLKDKKISYNICDGIITGN